MKKQMVVMAMMVLVAVLASLMTALVLKGCGSSSQPAYVNQAWTPRPAGYQDDEHYSLDRINAMAAEKYPERDWRAENAKRSREAAIGMALVTGSLRPGADSYTDEKGNTYYRNQQPDNKWQR